eukprot:156775-Pleurochrysis_carterae.AAC.1
MFFVATGCNTAGKKCSREHAGAPTRRRAAAQSHGPHIRVALRGHASSRRPRAAAHRSARSRCPAAEIQRAIHPRGDRRPPLLPAWHRRGGRP